MSAQTTSPPASPASVSSGIAIMSAAMIVLPCMDAIAKHLGTTVPPLQVAHGRFLFQTIVLIPFMLVAYRGALRSPERMWLHALRGCLIAGATIFFFSALRHMAVADAIAIFFVEPFIVTVLSAVILKEQVGWRRRIAVAVGFIGMLVIVRPGSGVFGLAALLPVGAAFCFAFFLIVTRRLANADPPIVTQFWTGVFGMIAVSAALAATSYGDVAGAVAVWPEPVEWAWLALIGIIAAFAHLCIVVAFQRAPASVLAPLNYVEIVGATAVGYVVFGDFPDGWTWTGIAIIVASGLYVFWRERQVGATA